MLTNMNEIRDMAVYVVERTAYRHDWTYDPVLLPRIECEDGFCFSAQAGSALYSIPREEMKESKYVAYELGYPSEPDELIEEYAEDEGDYTKTVYPYVPIEIVNGLLEKHGGFRRFVMS